MATIFIDEGKRAIRTVENAKCLNCGKRVKLEDGVPTQKCCEAPVFARG